MDSRLAARIAAALALVALWLAPPAQAQRPNAADLQRQLDALVAAEGGPPGAIVTLRRGATLTVFRAGVSDVASGRRPRPGDHMRIASVAKAFSGAVALRLVAEGGCA